MADKPKIDGYIWRQEINDALRATRAARGSLRKLLEHSDAGPAPRAILISEVALALNDILAALTNLQRIGDNSNGTDKE